MSALDAKDIWALKCLQMSPVGQSPFRCCATQCSQGSTSTFRLTALEKQALFLYTTVVEEALWMQKSRAASVQVLLFSSKNGSGLCVCHNPN